MANYSPPAFPRRPKRSNPLSELRYQLQLNYYRYEINTALYVMSPGEKLAYNILVLSFFLLFLSAVYYCLPSAFYQSIERLAYYSTGSSKLHVASVPIANAVQSSRQGVASLADAVERPDASLAFEP